jgi:hypothetical protein
MASFISKYEDEQDVVIEPAHSYIRQQCSHATTLSLVKVLAYIREVDSDIKKHELEVQIVELIESGFIYEIERYDYKNETLFLNC